MKWQVELYKRVLELTAYRSKFWGTQVKTVNLLRSSSWNGMVPYRTGSTCGLMLVGQMTNKFRGIPLTHVNNKRQFKHTQENKDVEWPYEIILK